jgi:ATP-dependent Lon protease
MLEVLDPAQNSSFRDHYLDLPFDLSQVLFICTANQLDTIPAPLRDRMEIISLSGYTEDEKVGIARRYLVPKQLEAHGLEPRQVTFTEKALRLLVREYTREAGVRNLDREIAAACRKAAREIAEGKRKGARVDEKRVRTWLGRRRFPSDPQKRVSEPGVATGLAVTPVGGDVLFVEATSMPGRGRLTITGQIGDVMKESAQAALSWVRGHAEQIGLESDWFEGRDVHIHVPAGAVPKDGPSAGIAMTTALVSLALGRSIADDVAMTGEITLTGRVLPIGGVKEKVLAAQRAGITTVILPQDNEGDLDDVQEDIRKSMRFVLAETIDEVLEAAFPAGTLVEFSRAAAG